MGASNLTEAVNMFLMTEFDQCFSECSSIIKAAKYDPEQERNHKLIEAATALGIQALAETDTWYGVVAFITDVYGTVELCPPSIIQLCILLHAQVREYLPCHKVMEMWMRNPHNKKHKQYSQVIRTYAYHILCPAGLFDVLKEIAETCDSLTQAERTALLQLSQTKRYEESRCLGMQADSPELPDLSDSNILGILHDSSELIQSINKASLSVIPDQDIASEIGYQNNVTETQDEPLETGSDGMSPLKAFLHWLYETIVNKFNYFWHPRFSLFILGVFTIWALIQTQSGDPVSSLGRFFVLWKLFFQRLGLLSESK